MKLTPRLQKIADEIKPGETMADIGTDHGFLPLFLWEQGISPQVIMADISKGSLDKAAENCRLLAPDTDFDLRLGSGLEVLAPGEVDTVVMAGIGGNLICELLGKDLQKSWSFPKYILQPRRHIGRLRFWLYDNGFSITNEQLVREGKFICEVLTVIPKEVAMTRQMNAEDIEYEFPLSLVRFRNDLTAEYLQGKLRLEREILESMKMGSLTTPKALQKQEYRVYYLTTLLRRCLDEA